METNMKKIVFSGLLCLVSVCAMSQIEPDLFARVDKAKMNHWVDSVFQTMNEDEKIGQLFMIVANPTLDAGNMQTLEGYVKNIRIGGILFHRGDAVTQADVTNRLQKSSRVPLFIALDGEWGLSMRLDGTTRFPKNMMLGAIENTCLIEEYGKEVGRQCKEMGIHINFAPVIDVNSNVNNPVIGIRSFGEDPKMVAERGIAYARGLEGAGILSVAKHFPGHGDTSEDSHDVLPVVRRSLASFDSVELLPFRRYITERFSGIMTAHIHVPALDKVQQAASVSKNVVTDLLKRDMGFTGLCFTDALVMKGATTGGISSPAVAALLAGNDVALAPASLTRELEAVKAAINSGILSREATDAKCKKLLQYKYIAGLHRYQPVDLKGLSERLNTSHAAWLAAKLNEEAITVLKNEDDCIPLRQLDQKKTAILTIGEPFGDEFQKTLNNYDALTRFQINTDTNENEIQRIARELEQYDVIICAVYTARISEHPILRQLAAKKEFIYTFFTLPYFCRSYSASIQRAKTVIMAYEGTPLAQEYAAQVIYGGTAAKGKLAVTIPGMYFAGTGVYTRKTRLGYHLPEEVGVDASRLHEIGAIVQEGLDQQAYPGCQVLVAKDGMVIYNQSFGYEDYQKKKEITASSVYDLASLTKATGTLLAVMKAYDDRTINLNAPLSLYLPTFQGTNKSDLKIEELLYHQTGLPAVINFYQQAIDKDSYSGSLYSSTSSTTHSVLYDQRTYVRTDFRFLPDIISNERKTGFTTEAGRHFFIHDSFKDSIISGIKDARLGTRGRYLYSCINFILLKMIVEKQTGQPIDQFLSDSFFNRLGARRMTYNPLKKIDTMEIVPTEDDRFIRRQLLRGYVHDEAAAFQGGVSGNAGLFSNANDLAKVLQLYLTHGNYGGESYLSESTCKLFTESKSPVSRRGLGFDKPDTGNARSSPCAESTPGSVFGHTGYTGGCFWIDPENKLIYIFLSNRLYPSRTNTKLFTLNIRTRVQSVIYNAFEKR